MDSELITSFEPVSHTKRKMSEEERRHKEDERDKVISMVFNSYRFINFLCDKYININRYVLLREYESLKQSKIDSAIALYVVLRDNAIYVTINDYVDYSILGGR